MARVKVTPRLILAVLFLAAVINYVDRQALSVAAPLLRELFAMSHTDYAQVVLAFMLAYGLMQPVAGWIMDRTGTRTGFTLAVLWWSVFSVLHAWASGVLSLGVFRFLLGVGEAGLLPATVKAISEWFPASQRAFAVGITNVGIGVGAVVTPPLMGWLILRFDWQTAFVVTGLSGFVWVALWLAVYRSPETPAGETSEGQAPAPTPAPPSRQESAVRPPLRWLLRRQEIWALMLARFLADPVWYFYLFWLPDYLSTTRGFSLREIGSFAWIPYVAAIAGNLLGGWLPGRLLRRGFSLTATRKGMAAGSAMLVPLAITAGFVPQAGLAIAIITLAVFLIWIWATTLFTLPADMFPSRLVGVATGLAGAAGSLGAVIFTPITGWVVDHFSYQPIFIAVGLLHPLAALLIWLMIPRVQLLNR